MPPKIVIDENIPFGREAFSDLGDVVVAPGRSIDRSLLMQAELLIVRSVTRVDRMLLDGSAVRFVGTATIGTDHIDVDYLRQAGIAFADASGCNANSVAEYVMAALLHVEKTRNESWEGKTLGVVGVGNVGKRVAAMSPALGLKALLNDPPRAEREGNRRFVPLDDLLDNSDVISLHTPLQKSGKYPTIGLFDDKRLHRVKNGAVLINTARGGIVDDSALLETLKTGRLGGAVLDVWENEPEPDAELALRADIATPHIAGYSFEGKIAGTRMIFKAACQFLGNERIWDDGRFDRPVERDRITVRGSGHDALRQAVFHAYPIEEDDRRMKRLLTEAANQRAAGFDRLRKEYPIRREFYRYEVAGDDLNSADIQNLTTLGFRTAANHHSTSIHSCGK